MIEVLFIKDWLKLKRRIANEEKYWKEKNEFLINEGRGVAGVTGKRVFTIDVGDLKKENVKELLDKMNQQFYGK